MKKENFGRLEEVEIEEGWSSEDRDFTPWLAEEENLALLGEAIGIDLELEAKEKSVGPFRADILCKDTATNNWVLIENQLDRTDHKHLGQLLMYASGLDAVTIVWIAREFTDEHKATLGWLNRITNKNFNFFGIEIKLWRIGSSQIAPKFNVVCEPNDWSKLVSEAARQIDAGEYSGTKQLQYEYWSELRKMLLEKRSIIRPTKALPQHWMNFSLGRTNFGMFAAVNTIKHVITVGVGCYGQNAKSHFHLLEEDKEAIEEEIGTELQWLPLPNRKVSRIEVVKQNADPTNKEDWPNQNEWMVKMLVAFYKAFSSRVKGLNLEDYRSEDTD